MSSSQCLRRLAANPPLRPTASLKLGLTSCRTTSRLPAGARSPYASYARSKSSSHSYPRTPLYITQTRQFSLAARYNEEKTVKTPEMAESITEGTLKGWNKSVGDYVELDEEIGSIETDKIDVAINAPAAGTIKKFLVEAEATIEVGQDILVLELGGSPPAEGQQSSGQQDSSQQAEQGSQEQKAPQQQSGGSPKNDSTPHMPPPETTKTQEQPKQSNIETSNQTQPSNQSQQQQQQDSGRMQQSGSPQPQSKGQESSTQAQQQQSSTQQKQQESSPKTEMASPYGTREERRVKMNRMRLRIAERLKQSQNTAASLTTFNEVDMSNLMEMRKQYKDEILNKTGIKFGFMGAFAMASVLGMKAVPTVNASIEGPGGGDTIVYRDYVDVSVAVATEKGLVTPVVRNAESLDIVGIERAISELGKKARDNKLTIEDMAGGTFTISNGGVFGSLMGTPIINLPQTAVLGLHAIKDKPVAINGKVEIRPMMYLALTYDHRLLDGREAVTFLVKIKEYIEDPRKMLLALP